MVQRWLFPISILYGLIIRLRNLAFDRRILRQSAFGIPVIVAGNISTGGTGKSPLTIYLARLLAPSKRVAILSRGYGRHTSGYVRVSSAHTAREVGDEPLQYAVTMPEVAVAVCEKRVVGIKRLLDLTPAPDVVLLDDAFQHRYVKPSLSLLLTEFNAPFSDDLLLPAGRLREPPSSANRADAIVVTKCPEDLSSGAALAMASKLRKRPDQPVFFSTVRYAQPVSAGPGFNDEQFLVEKSAVFFFCGIARPSYPLDYLKERSLKLETRIFPDHHSYSIDELQAIVSDFRKFASANESRTSLLLTTRKDLMRLHNTNELSLFNGLPFFILDIETFFLNYPWNDFDHFITGHLELPGKAS